MHYFLCRKILNNYVNGGKIKNDTLFSEYRGETRMGKRNKKQEKLNKNAKIPKTKSIRQMERSAGFWNRFDWINKFRHWYIGVKSFASGIFRVLAAWQTIVVLTAALVALYIFTAFYTGKGEFVIQVDRPMANEGFILSDDGDFSEWLVTLRADAVENATNINITDIPKDVMEINGKHNGRDYLAYTFYLKNKSGDTRDYEYRITIQNTYKGAEQATWLMVYHNGRQEIFAAPNKNGHEECQYSRFTFPFTQDAADKDYQLTTISDAKPGYITQDVISYHEFGSLDGIFELHTVPFESEEVICRRLRKEIGPDEVDKFTVVIWLEGEDPECVNEILGGYVEMNMKFRLADEEK